MHKNNTLSQLRLTDYVVFFAVFSTIALHNYTGILIISQLASFLILAIQKFRLRHIPKSLALYIGWILFFALLCAFSYFYAIHTERVVSAVISLIQVLLMGMSIILYNESEIRTKRLFYYAAIGCVGIMLRLLVQVPMAAWGTERVGNYLGYGNNGASTALIYVSLLMIYAYRNSDEKKEKLLALLTAIGCIIFSLLCGSKKAVLVATIGIGLQLSFSSKKPAVFVRRLIISILLGVCLYYAIMRIDILYNALGFRIQQMIWTLNGSGRGDASTNDRIAFAFQAIEIFKEHPILGVGIDNFRYYNFKQFYSHNNYLEIASCLGILGVFAYYWFPFRLFFKSIKNRGNQVYLLVSTFMLTILIMDIGTVSYSIDSIQLYIAIVYSMFVLETYHKKGLKTVQL